MVKQTTTIRLEPQFRREILRQAKKAGLNFSSIVQLLLQAFLDGTVHIGVTQHPQRYIDVIDKEADVLRIANRRGKVRRYSSSKELFDDILKR